MGAYFQRGVEEVEKVARELDRGAGTKKAEREDFVRRLNGALAAFKSAVHHGEVPGTTVIPTELDDHGVRR